ncbi:MAG: hypothetical protein ACQEQL_04105 [Pseudomonadota bacterium]
MLKQQGNALFLILIAVALFAALSYAVTQSGRGGGDIEREQQMIQIAQMLQAHAAIKTAADRMVILTTAPADLTTHGVDTETPCTTGADCVFAPDGGEAADLDANDWGTIISSPTISYYEADDGASVDGLGAAAADVFIVTSGLTEAACTEINEQLGLTTPVETDSTDDLVYGDGTSYSGEWSFCVQLSSTGTPYAYIQALAAQ